MWHGMAWHGIVLFVNCGGSLFTAERLPFFAPQCNCHRVAHFETIPTAIVFAVNARVVFQSINKIAHAQRAFETPFHGRK